MSFFLIFLEWLSYFLIIVRPSQVYLLVDIELELYGYMNAAQSRLLSLGASW